VEQIQPHASAYVDLMHLPVCDLMHPLVFDLVHPLEPTQATVHPATQAVQLPPNSDAHTACTLTVHVQRMQGSFMCCWTVQSRYIPHALLHRHAGLRASCST
jgi:hypothetical protein